MAFGYYMQLAVQHAKVPNTDQAAFPVLVRSAVGTGATRKSRVIGGGVF